MTNPHRLTEVTGSASVRRLQTRILVAKAVTEVWSAITETKHLGHWWTNGTVGKHAGEAIQLAEPEDLNGTIICMRAPHVFEFTWHDNLSEAAHPEWIEPSTNGLVRFDLTEASGNNTLVTLMQFAPAESAFDAAAGWHELLERLKEYLERGVVADNPDRFNELKKIYAKSSAGDQDDSNNSSEGSPSASR